MARSQDGGAYSRPAKRTGDASGDYQPLQVDPASGALLVTGAGAEPSATALRIADGLLPTEAEVTAGRLRVETDLDPLTDAQLRSAPLPVAGPLTRTQLDAAPVAVDTGLTLPQPQTDALTNSQLRAAPVPVDTGLLIPQPQTDALTAGQLDARGLATNAALVPLLDSVEALLTAVRDRLPPAPHSQPLTAAEALTTPVRIREGLAFYSSPDGSRMAFNATTDIMTLTSTGEQPLAAISNPAGSGVDFLLWYGEFSTSANADLRRYRGATVTGTGTPQQWANMGGGTATMPVLFYRGGTIGGVGPQYTATGGIVSKTAQIGARIHYPAEEHFAVRIRPGQATRWTIVGPGGLGGTFTAAIYLAGALVPTGT